MKKKQTKKHFTEANPTAAEVSQAPPPVEPPALTNGLLEQIHLNILNLNGSKLFAGVVMIMLNVGSKFIPVQFSKSAEEYLKQSVSKALLVFAMSWMGTRDIYTAVFLTLLFVVLSDYLFNEESMFCIVPHDKRILESIQSSSPSSPSATSTASPTTTNPTTTSSSPTPTSSSNELSKQTLQLIENARKKIAGEYKSA